MGHLLPEFRAVAQRTVCSPDRSVHMATKAGCKPHSGQNSCSSHSFAEHQHRVGLGSAGALLVDHGPVA